MPVILIRSLKSYFTIGFGVLSIILSASFSFGFNNLKEKWLESVSAIEKSNSYVLNSETIQLKNKLREEEWINRDAYFSDIVENYLNQQLDLPPVIHYLSQMKESDSYFNSLTNLILSKSLEKIKNSKNSNIMALMQKYKLSYSEDSIPLFRITGDSINRPSPIIEKGGFHFDKKSIFTDITRTKNNEFLFIFLHELYHILDDELFESTKLFTNSDTLIEMKTLAENFNSIHGLAPLQQNKLQTWLYAGLNRHLFAEWRAWLFCFSVYQEGIEEKLWGHIPFIEEILAQKSPEEDLSIFLYQYLNAKGKTIESFLQKPLFSEVINKLRNEFNPSKQLPFPFSEENSNNSSSSILDNFFSLFHSKGTD